MSLIAPAATTGTNATDPTSGTNDQPVRQSGATGALGGMGSDAFMKLLVAQMRYQNPMSPQDGTEYLAQVSQYAMVEQLQKVSQGQEEVSGYQRALMATSMVGAQVTGTGEAGNPLTGTVLRVEYRSGKPALITTDGTIEVDKVDALSSPTAHVPSTDGAATGAAGNTQDTSGSTGQTQTDEQTQTDPATTTTEGK
jgi:flagellar basal-body rod modification protein FlgD